MLRSPGQGCPLIAFTLGRIDAGYTQASTNRTIPATNQTIAINVIHIAFDERAAAKAADGLEAASAKAQIGTSRPATATMKTMNMSGPRISPFMVSTSTRRPPDQDDDQEPPRGLGLLEWARAPPSRSSLDHRDVPTGPRRIRGTGWLRTRIRAGGRCTGGTRVALARAASHPLFLGGHRLPRGRHWSGVFRERLQRARLRVDPSPSPGNWDGGVAHGSSGGRVGPGRSGRE